MFKKVSCLLKLKEISMNELKDVNKMTPAEKREIIEGTPVFETQDDKIESINGLIDFMDSMISQHKNGNDLNTLFTTKLIKYFLEEHRDVLEEYELDYTDNE